jgi:hypothetical protein
MTDFSPHGQAVMGEASARLRPKGDPPVVLVVVLDFFTAGRPRTTMTTSTIRRFRVLTVVVTIGLFSFSRKTSTSTITRTSANEGTAEWGPFSPAYPKPRLTR